MSYAPNHRTRDGEYVWKSTAIDFWSGTDARVEIRSNRNNFVLLPDVVNLQIELLEAVQPVYSYASYTADLFIRGARRVQGAMTMNFRSTGFLYTLLDSIDSPALAAANPPVAGQTSDYRKSGLDIDGFISLVSNDRTKSPPNTAKRYSSNPEAVKKYTADLEATFWGSSRKVSSAANRVATEAASLTKPKFPTDKNLELYIEFGHNTFNDENTISKFKANLNFPDLGKDKPLAQKTSRIIKDIQFNGLNSQYDDSGRPIVEVYTFIARDMI